MLRPVRSRIVVAFAGLVAASTLAACVPVAVPVGTNPTPTTKPRPPSTQVPTLPTTPPVGTAVSTTPRITFYYQRINQPADVTKLGANEIVVTGGAGQTDAQAKRSAQLISASGALPFLYTNWYWMPAGSTYQDINIGAQPAFAFCTSGSTPAVGRTVSGVPWWYFDLNERAAHTAAMAYIREVKAEGYAGVMVDRGAVTLLGGKDPQGTNLSSKVSTCTRDPLVRGRNFADSFVSFLGDIRAAGLKVLLNYGSHPQGANTRMRPASSCTPLAPPACPTVRDVWGKVDFVLNESTAVTKTDAKLADWRAALDANLAAEKATDPLERAKTINLVKEPATPGQRDRVFYRFASAKLADLPAAVNTGDDQCGGQDTLCLRTGLFPEVTGLALGPVASVAPTAFSCSATANDCVYLRRYRDALVVVNQRNQPVSTSISLGASCRRLTDRWGKGPVPGGCLKTLTLTLPAKSGRIFTYS